MFLGLSMMKIIILASVVLSSANAFNFDEAKILSFGKGFNIGVIFMSFPCQRIILLHYYTPQNKCFDSACLCVCFSIHVSVCAQSTRFCQSTGGGIKSHLVTALVQSVNPCPNKPWFLRVYSTGLLKTLGKGETAHNKQFLLFPQCFLSIWKAFCHFNQRRNCRLQTLSIWKTLNLSFAKGLNTKCI